MQISRSALVLLFPFASTLSTFAAAPKVHTVGLGGARRVPFVAADVAKEDKADESKTLKIRPLIVDDKQKEWTTGDLHDVTDRSFVIQRALHVNDTLPGEKSSRWTWQPGPWLLVDRISGHISALHLPDFDASISDVVWYRDYAAYCGVKTTVRNGGLVADTWQVGARKAAVSHLLGKWPQPDHLRPHMHSSNVATRTHASNHATHQRNPNHLRHSRHLRSPHRRHLRRRPMIKDPSFRPKRSEVEKPAFKHIQTTENSTIEYQTTQPSTIELPHLISHRCCLTINIQHHYEELTVCRRLQTHRCLI